jgi:DNA helicase MCM8
VHARLQLSPDGGLGFALPVDFAQAKARVNVPDLFAALDMAPTEALACLAAAAHAVGLLSGDGRSRLAHLQPVFADSRVRVHLYNHSDTLHPFRGIRSSLLGAPEKGLSLSLSPSHAHASRLSPAGRLVTVRGTVIRVSGVRTLVTRAPFSCSKCGARQLVHLPDGIPTPPAKCISDGCRGRKFVEERDGAQGVDLQRVRLQELPGRMGTGPMLRVGDHAPPHGGLLGDGGTSEEDVMARTLDVELTAALCDALSAGDVVNVTGIVQALADGTVPSASAPAGASGGGGPSGGARPKADDRAAATYVLHIHAVGLVRSRREAAHRGGESLDDTRLVMSGPPACVMHARRDNGGGSSSAAGCGVPAAGLVAPFSDAQLAFVAHFATVAASEAGPSSCGAWRLLTQSLCPGIHGLDAAKAGLVLALLGGTPLPPPPPGGDPVMSLRHDIHVLLVGDPGVGKSQLLSAAAAASPRGVYVSGPGATAVGLTAAVGRDPATGAPCLEAGACALASGGTVCVDELDKLPKAQHGALLEVMEQGTVSVAKAGVTASMDARCSVVAAANPGGGRYSHALTLAENLKLSPALLSRFDLVFLLVDQHDCGQDAAMAASVMAAHQQTGQRPRLQGPTQLRALPAVASQAEQQAPLTARLRCA